MPFPVSPEEIAKTEAKAGFTFPTGFKLRLSKDNGGKIEIADDDWQLIPFLDTTDRKRISRTCNDIVKETASMRELSDFPANAFVVAKNGSECCLILLPETEDSTRLGETIYLRDMETGEYEPVADSLDAI